MSEQRFIRRSIANIAVLRLYTDKVHQSLLFQEGKVKHKTRETEYRDSCLDTTG